jgi:WD40 repeat protein
MDDVLRTTEGDRTGETIQGYELRERIGQGGFGAVYRAFQPLLNREVALKVIHPHYANHPDFIRRFEAEAHLVARLEHLHIVPLYDYWRDPSGAYLALRYMRGGSLLDQLAAGPLPLDTAGVVLEQIGAALAFAHRHGVVHRDLKPANILRDEDGNYYLADFGIAKDLGRPADGATTEAGVLLGSPAYIAPEQIREEAVSPQTDIYSLGVVLYEMLAGRKPFAGTTPIDLLTQHLHKPLPPLRPLRPELPPPLDGVIQRATAKLPAQRYPDVPSLLADFRQVGVPGDRTPPLTPIPSDWNTPVLLDDSSLENPYKGLRAFQEADAGDFFGREALTARLLGRLGEAGPGARLLAVVGPSGSGKSSVVRAGLLPALRSGGMPGADHWFVAELIPGAHPWEELEAALLRVAVNPPGSLLEQLQADERGLVRAVKRALPADDAIELLLLIDQFEEVFTLVEDEARRQQFLASLVAAVTDPRSRLRVVLTLRADFYDRPLLYPRLGELLREHTEVVLPLATDELEAAIRRPAERVGAQLEPGLVTAIVQDVGTQPGALPLLQYSLTELFERRVGRKLTLAAYQASGGVLGALARRAEEIYTGLDATAQATARQVFLRLVTLGEGVEDTRRRVRLSELTSLMEQADPAALDSALDAFGQARLLTFDRDLITREPTVEVAHEALLRTWTRLREWLDSSRADLRVQRQLAGAASEWAAGQDTSFLASGSRLAQFAALADANAVALTAEERSYLEASRREQQRQEYEEHQRAAHELDLARRAAEAAQQAEAAARRAEAAQRSAANRMRGLVGALAVFLLVAAGLAAFAYSQEQEALTQRAAAEAGLQRVQGFRLAAEANSLSLTHGPSELIALLSVRALNLAYSPQGEAALDAAALQRPDARVFRGHTGLVREVAFSPDGKLLAAASDDQTVRIWDLAGGATVQILKDLPAPTDGVAFAPDGKSLATGDDAANIYFWDLETGKQTRALVGTKNAIEYVRFSSDGKYLLTPDGDVANLWDIASGKIVQTFAGHKNGVFPALSPDGKYVFTASLDGEAWLWDAATGQRIRQFTEQKGIGAAAAFSPDGRLVAAGGGNADSSESAFSTEVRLWEAATGKQVQILTGALGVYSMAFSPDGRFLVTGGEKNVAQIWDVARGQQAAILYGHTEGIFGVAVSPDGKYIATGSKDQTVRLWPMQTRPGPRIFSGHTAGVWNVAVSPDGTRLVTGSDDRTARIWDVATGQELVRLTGHTERPGCAIFSADGKTVLTTSLDGTARLWDAATGTQLRVFSGHTAGINRAFFSPDGKTIVTASDDRSVRLWDVATGAQLAKFDGPAEGVRAMFSPDGKTILTGWGNGLLRLYDVASGRPVRDYGTPSSSYVRPAFSPDGKQFVSAGDDGTARLWDVAGGQEIRRFDVPQGGVRVAEFSPDGTRIATAGSDGIARLFDVQSGKEIARYSGHSAEVRGVAFSPDGKDLFTASLDNTARLWFTDYHDTISYLCGLLQRDLLPEERVRYDITDPAPTCPRP